MPQTNVNHPRRRWTRDEFILSLDLYFRIPFGSIGRNNPDVVKLALLLNRTPSSIAMRLCNYASCDPELRKRGVTGLLAGMTQCLPYWNEFSNNLAELRRAALISREHVLGTVTYDENVFHHMVTEWDALVDDMYNIKFQNIIENNYHGRCAISGLEVPELLVGCHILPADENESSCLHPSNGIFLNLTVAKAFINGLIGFDSDYIIHLSDKLKEHKFEGGYSQYFGRYEGKKLLVNDVIVKPNPEYLQWHMDSVFNQ